MRLPSYRPQLIFARQADSNAAHSFVLLRQSFGEQLAQENEALVKAKADKTGFSTALAAEREDLAVFEKSLPAVVALLCAREGEFRP